MKKCASLLGVSSDIYRGRFSVIRAGTQGYYELLTKFRLNSYSRQFREGIVLLPDDYKRYYEEKGWKGIFISDLNRLGNSNEESLKLEELRKLYQLGNSGALDGFDDWVQKMTNKGITFKQMDYILSEVINKKGIRTLDKIGDGTSKINGRSQETSQYSPTDTVINEQLPLHAILKNIEVVGDQQTYYKLLFDFKGVQTEVFAIAAVMEQVDKLTLKEGDTCAILTRQAKGKNILRQIQLAG